MATNNYIEYMDKYGINEPMTIGRWLVELMFYFVVIAREFGNELGVLQIQGLSGAFILIAGAISFLIIISGKHRIPFGVYIAVPITVIVFFTLLRVYGSSFFEAYEDRPMLYGICYLLMAGFFLRNRAACYRCLIIFSFIIIIAVRLAGYDKTGSVERLILEGGTGSAFANANDLGYMGAFVAVGSLFYGLISSKKIKIVLWTLSITGLYILLKTVSRGALLSFAMGIAVFAFAVIFGKGNKIMVVILILLGLFAAGKIAYELTTIKESYIKRIHDDTGRLATWKASGSDLASTMLFGRGGGDNAAVKKTGIIPHNAFLWLHIAYGGMAAWLYLFWMSTMALRTLKMFFMKDYVLQGKLLVMGIFAVIFGMHMPSNNVLPMYLTALCMSIIDNNVFPYSSYNIRNRTFYSDSQPESL